MNWAASELEGSPRQILGKETNRDRRAIRRDEGGSRRVLALEVRVVAGGDRLGQALPESYAGGVRARDSASVRG